MLVGVIFWFEAWMGTWISPVLVGHCWCHDVWFRLLRFDVVCLFWRACQCWCGLFFWALFSAMNSRLFLTCFLVCWFFVAICFSQVSLSYLDSLLRSVRASFVSVCALYVVHFCFSISVTTKKIEVPTLHCVGGLVVQFPFHIQVVLVTFVGALFFSNIIFCLELTTQCQHIGTCTGVVWVCCAYNSCVHALAWVRKSASPSVFCASRCREPVAQMTSRTTPMDLMMSVHAVVRDVICATGLRHQLAQKTLGDVRREISTLLPSACPKIIDAALGQNFLL